MGTTATELQSTSQPQTESSAPTAAREVYGYYAPAAAATSAAASGAVIDEQEIARMEAHGYLTPSLGVKMGDGIVERPLPGGAGR